MSTRQINLKTYLASLSLICFSLLTLPMLRAFSYEENVVETRPRVVEVIKERERKCQEDIIEAKKYLVSHYEDVEKNIFNIISILNWYSKDWVTPKEDIPCEKVKDRSDCVDCLFLALSKFSFNYQQEHAPNGEGEVIELLDKVIEQDVSPEMKVYGLIVKILAYTELQGVDTLEEDAKKSIKICDIVIKNYPKSYPAALAQLFKGGAFMYRDEYDKAIIEFKKVKDYSSAYEYWGENLHSFSEDGIEEALEEKKRKEELLKKGKNQKPVIEQFR